jgi:hypothetical protein
MPRPIALFLLFLGVTVGFAWYRHGVPFVWDDSPNITGGLAHSRWIKELAQPGAGVELSQTLVHLGQDTFGYVTGGGYRPLSLLYSFLTYWFLVGPEGPSLGLLLVVGSIHGCLAVSLVCLARRFVRHSPTAWFAAFLVMASPPAAATAWVLMTTVQAVVPLLICLALICYFRMLQPGRRLGSRAALLAIMFLGPWFREFLGIVPILIGILEVQRCRRLTLWLGIAVACLLHALYPTAFVRWLFFPELPLEPVFVMGNLGGAINGSSMMRWYGAWHLLPLFPPSLLVLVLLPVIAAAGGQVLRNFAARRVIVEDGEAGDDNRRECWPAFLLLAWLGLAVLLLVTGWASTLDGFVLCLGFAAVGLWRARSKAPGVMEQRYYGILPAWFLLAFVPMMRVFTEHIHFFYALPSAAIILAREVEVVWDSLTMSAAEAVPTSRRSALGARAGLSVFLAVITADQGLNLVGARQVNAATYGGMKDLASWFTTHVPRASLVVSNVIHSEEIKTHAGGHFETYWTLAGGVCDRRRVVDDYAKLTQLISDRGDRDIYFLAASYDYLPGQAGYHRHKFVDLTALDKRFLGVVQRTKVRYFFLDPLRHLVLRPFIPFLGAPDLVNDFYCGLPHHRWLFRYECYTDYRVYRLARP